MAASDSMVDEPEVVEFAGTDGDDNPNDFESADDPSPPHAADGNFEPAEANDDDADEEVDLADPADLRRRLVEEVEEIILASSASGEHEEAFVITRMGVPLQGRFASWVCTIYVLLLYAMRKLGASCVLVQVVFFLLGLLMALCGYSIEVSPEQLLRRVCGSTDNELVAFVQCVSCSSLYTLSESKINGKGRTCSFVSHPHHPQGRFRQPCGHALLDSQLRPLRQFFFINPVYALRRLLNRPDFVTACNAWRSARSRGRYAGVYSDVYDGEIFGRLLESGFFDSRYHIALGLNFDYMRPFGLHNTRHLGLFYLSILDLPRAMRVRQPFILPVAMVSGPESSHDLNKLLRPLITVLSQLYQYGFPLGESQVRSAVVHFLPGFSTSSVPRV
jgi:hypothetical protein